MLHFNPGESVLDVASPQWFTLYLAACNPDVRLNYINILDSEIENYRIIAANLGLKNLDYSKEDVRKLPFKPMSFDKVISISVLEHISPENGGDIIAFKEIRRVLRNNGDMFITVPCKKVQNTVYMNGPVFERNNEGERTFFAREYDMDSFHQLVEVTNFFIAEEYRIEERQGLFAVDYWEWGDGRNKIFWPKLIRARRILERIIGYSFDETLATRHLLVTKHQIGRLINVAARLKKNSPDN
jgi:SAM-dependent methyltransferase